MGVILFIITPFVLFLGALSLFYYILTIYHAFYILLLPFSGLYLLCYKKYKLGLKVVFIGWIRLFEYFLILYIGTVSQNVLIVCLNFNIFYKFLFSKYFFLNLLTNFLFIRGNSILYFFLLYKINDGIVHIYLLFIFLISFFLYNKLFRKIRTG